MVERNAQNQLDKIMQQCTYYAGEGQFEKAEVLIERLVNLQVEMLSENHPTVALNLKYWADLKRDQRKFQEASEILNRALKIQLNTVGETHLDTANTYQDLGFVLSSLGDSEKSEAMFRKSADIKLTLDPHDHDVMGMPAVENGIAAALQSQGKTSEAYKMQKQLLATRLKMYGEYHPTVLMSYIAIAGILRKEKRLDDSIKMLDKSIEVSNRLEREHVEGYDPMMVVAMLKSKGTVFMEQHNYDGAADCFEKMLHRQIGVFGAMHPFLVDTYVLIANANVGQYLLEDAIKLLQKCLAIRRLSPGNGTMIACSTKDIRTNIGVIQCLRIGEYLHQRGFATMKNKQIKGGDTCRESAELAVKIWQESANTYLAVLPFYSVDHRIMYAKMSQVLENIADVRVEQGLLQEAVDASRQALVTRRKMYGDDHVDTKRRMEAHKSLLRKLFTN